MLSFRATDLWRDHPLGEDMSNRNPAIEAILLMDSCTTSIAVRDQNLSSFWNKLYKLEEYYLSMHAGAR